MSAAVCPRLASATRSRTSRQVGNRPSLRATASRGNLRVKAAAEVQVSTASQNGVSPSQTAGKDDVQGPMLTPSVVNTNWVRSFTMFAAVAAAASTTAVLPARVSAFAHVLSYGLWLGANIWNTFFVGLTMFKTMPRQTFGRTQAALFPKYFGITTGANIVLLATLLLSTSATPLSAASLGAAALKAPAVTLVIGLLSNLINAVSLEPKTTAIMFQRYELENKAEKTEDDKSQIARLQSQFGKLHGMSSLMNLINTCAALAYGWYLAAGLSL